jgi:hypothetical protein
VTLIVRKRAGEAHEQGDGVAITHVNRQVGCRQKRTHGMRTAEMEKMRKLVRELRADAKRLVELT